MMSKSEGNAARKAELKKQWKKHKKKVLKNLSARFRKNIKSYTKPKSTKLQSVFLYGETGVGKTVAANFLFLDFIRQTFMLRGVFSSIKYHAMNVSEMFMQFQLSFNDAKKQSELFDLYLDCDILFLDDIGVRATTPWVYDMLYHIINNRYENEKITIITSNMSLNDLSKKMGDDRIIRRIAETYFVVEKEHFKKMKN